MKIISSTALALICICSLCYAGSVSVDSAAGFKDVRFGTPISNITGLNVTKQEGHLKEAVRDTDDTSIDSIPCETITYLFYKDQFYGVIAKSKDYVYEPFKLYGKAPVMNRVGTSQINIWRGKTVELTVSVATMDGELSTYTLLYLPLSRLAKAEHDKLHPPDDAM